jgi:uncharacterized membrane protein YbhN (UPF0104 family)
MQEWCRMSRSSDPSELTGVEIDEPPAPTVLRTPTDVIRLVVAVAVLVFSIAATRALPDAVRGLERDLLSLTGAGNPSVSGVIAVIQIALVYAPLVLLAVLVVLGRFRRLLVIIGTVVVTAVVLRGVGYLLDVRVSNPAVNRITGRGFHLIHAFPSLTYVAAAMAVATVERSWYHRGWRRATAALVVLVALTHLASYNAPRDVLPVDLLTAVAAGWVVGRGARLAFGRPNRRPAGRDVMIALARSGVAVNRVSAASEPWHGSQVYRAWRPDGRGVFVKLTLIDDRGGDALIRLYRFLRFRQTGEEHPFWSPARLVEHEALLTFTAHGSGVHTPGVIAVAAVGEGDGRLLAVEEVEGGVSLASIDAARLDDTTLVCAWEVASALRSSRIAHRDLNLDTFLLDDGGQVWIVGFGSAESQADLQLLDNDVAELLSSSAARVGAPRAVAAAVAVIGPDAVAAALPRLQPLALSARTRSDLRSASEPERPSSLLDELVDEVCRATDTTAAPLEQLQRVKPRTVLLFVMSALAVYALLPQLVQAPDIARHVSEADPWWILGAVVASMVSYVGAACALTGSVPTRVRLGMATVAQVGSQFANFATPASVGGMALNVRFLQKQGTDAPVAVAAVGLNAVTGVVVHTMLLAAVAVSVGAEGETPLPSLTTVLAVVAVLVVVAGAVSLVPAGRTIVVGRVLPIVRRSVGGLIEIARRPEKLLALVGGAVLLTGAYVAALACAVYAFDGDVPLMTIAFVFLGASIVAAVAPTPGGLGAVEAALVAGFASVGVGGEIALPAVVVFRFATFWLPLLPGWLAFTGMQRRGII